MSDEVFTQLVALLSSEAFGVQQAVALDTQFADLDGWDSFKHLRFFLEVEELFDFELSPEQGEAITTLGELAEAVVRS